MGGVSHTACCLRNIVPFIHWKRTRHLTLGCMSNTRESFNSQLLHPAGALLRFVSCAVTLCLPTPPTPPASQTTSHIFHPCTVLQIREQNAHAVFMCGTLGVIWAVSWSLVVHMQTIIMSPRGQPLPGMRGMGSTVLIG